jgi:hypothetical protein
MTYEASRTQDSRSGLRLGDMVSEYLPNHRTAKPWGWNRPAVAPSADAVADASGLRVGLPE